MLHSILFFKVRCHQLPYAPQVWFLVLEAAILQHASSLNYLSLSWLCTAFGNAREIHTPNVQIFELFQAALFSEGVLPRLDISHVINGLYFFAAFPDFAVLYHPYMRDLLDQVLARDIYTLKVTHAA